MGAQQQCESIVALRRAQKKNAMPSLFQLAALAVAIAVPGAAGWAFFGAALGDGDDAGDGVAQVRGGASSSSDQKGGRRDTSK